MSEPLTAQEREQLVKVQYHLDGLTDLLRDMTTSTQYISWLIRDALRGYRSLDGRELHRQIRMHTSEIHDLANRTDELMEAAESYSGEAFHQSAFDALTGAAMLTPEEQTGYRPAEEHDSAHEDAAWQDTLAPRIHEEISVEDGETQSFGQILRQLVEKADNYIHEEELHSAIRVLRKAEMLPPVENPPTGPPSCGDRGCGYRSCVGPCGNTELPPF